MKRLRIILGRSGTTLVAISLALLLVSAIPQPQFSSSSGSGLLSSEQFRIIASQQDLTPQQELEIKIAVEGALKIYLLEMSGLIQFTVGDVDVASQEMIEGFEMLEQLAKEIVETQPDRIVWEREIQDGYYSRKYIPTRIINATIVLYNPSSETVHVEHAVSLKSSLAPEEKVQTIAYVAAPLGIILALPWLVDSWKRRKQS